MWLDCQRLFSLSVIWIPCHLNLDQDLNSRRHRSMATVRFQIFTPVVISVRIQGITLTVVASPFRVSKTIVVENDSAKKYPGGCGCQGVGVPGLGSRLSTYWNPLWRCSHQNSADHNGTPCDTWIKTKSEGVKNWRPGSYNPDKLCLSCKVTKCNDVWTGDLGVLTTHGTSPGRGECRRKYK